LGCGIIKNISTNVLEDYSVNYSGCDVYIKSVIIPEGLEVISHKHSFSHLAILMSGKVLVTVDGDEFELESGQSTIIKADKYHSVKALEQSLWLCCWNISNLSIEDYTDYEMIDKSLIK